MAGELAVDHASRWDRPHITAVRVSYGLQAVTVRCCFSADNFH